MYKLILTVDESLALITYVGLLNYFFKEEKLHNIERILNEHTNIKSFISRSEVIFTIDFLRLTLIREFIVDQLNGPLAKYDFDKDMFMTILQKIDNSLVSTN